MWGYLWRWPFSKYHQVTGFDINETRVAELNSGYDRTLEISKEELLALINGEESSSIMGYVASSDLTDIRDAQGIYYYRTYAC